MRRFLPLTVVLVCLFTAAFAQKPGSAPAKPAEKAAGDNSQEAFVVEQSRTIYRFENDGTGMREVYLRVRIQSEAALQQWGQLVIGYNSASERLDMQYVRVLKKDGTTVTAPADSIQDLSSPVERDAPVYTDFRQKHVTVPGLRPGEVLEYHIAASVHTPLAPGQFWAEYDFNQTLIVLDEQLEINVPSGRTVKLKTKPGFDPKITEEGGRRIYRWTSSHAVRDDEDKEKAKKRRRPEEPEQPEVRITTFASWEELGRWYAGLERERRKPSPEVRAKAEELTKGLKTDTEKIEALYDFVAKNFRYVSLSLGLGRYQPHAAGDVLHNQYGDCKDKHTLLAALLDTQGLRASSVLINSSRKLDPEMPSPSQFDHVITLVPLAKDSVWMDTTAEIAPFRLLAYELRKKQALVIPAEGAPHLEETPADPPVPNYVHQEVDAKLSELGKIDAQVKTVVRGDGELLYRTIFRRVPNSDWKQVVERMSRMSGLDGTVSEVKVGDPAATRQPFELSFRVERANFFDWSKKKTEIGLPFAQMSLPAAGSDDEEPRTQPLKLGSPAEHTVRVKLELPARYSGRAPLPFAMKRDYAAYEATYKLEGQIFTAERKLILREREVPVANVEDYAAFRRAVYADSRQVLSVENTVAGAPAPPKDVKADDLNDSARAAMVNGNLTLAVDLLKRAVEVDPKHKLAWNNLGVVYLNLRRTDEAIAAFQKQLEVNRYDQYAYNNMGRAYLMDRKYEQAADAFRKQLEINPLDRSAHANLGGLYLDWQKYQEAVPELEKAISLVSDDAALHVSLGTAYLNLNQDDKAQASFDRALEISATPTVWNNIAYRLSLKKTRLDKAKQYAESAVSTTAAALRNVSLDQLSLRDLPLVPSLTAYWDTLGWTCFQNNDLDKAEAYVAASWAVSQHSEVGDHLAQIHEKRGRKGDAVRTYALALNAVRPDPEVRRRLAALVGAENKVDAEVARYRDELQMLRTVKLANPTKQAGTADFFVLLEQRGSGTTASAVKFVSGVEGLKGMAEVLRTTKFPLKFPDAAPTRIPRRGTMSCSPAGCTFVLTLPDDVKSVD